MYIDSNAMYNRNTCLLLGFGNVTLNIVFTMLKHYIHTSRIFQKQLSFAAFVKKIRYNMILERLAFKKLPYLRPFQANKYWSVLVNGDSTVFRV